MLVEKVGLGWVFESYIYIKIIFIIINIIIMLFFSFEWSPTHKLYIFKKKQIYLIIIYTCLLRNNNDVDHVT